MDSILKHNTVFLQERYASWHQQNSSVARAANAALPTFTRSPSTTTRPGGRAANADVTIVPQPPPRTTSITVSSKKRVDRRLLNRTQRALVRVLTGTWNQKPHEVLELTKWQVSDKTLRKAARNAYAALEKDNEELDAALLAGGNAAKKLKLPNGITYASIVARIITRRKQVPECATGTAPSNGNDNSVHGSASDLGELSALYRGPISVAATLLRSGAPPPPLWVHLLPRTSPTAGLSPTGGRHPEAIDWVPGSPLSVSLPCAAASEGTPVELLRKLLARRLG
ncbi:hypothetical protein C8R43DRAFT_1243188 [Mycena crocata]|nr:hypothetical protein C8R43DRAFT_1243188 [Mycena crocata]